MEEKVVPISLAATVILVDDRPDLQVFMMKRNARTRFAGGMWVFPGGAVDGADNSGRYQKACTHRTEENASKELGVKSGALAYYVAAIREAFEEAGVLLALHSRSEEPLRLMDDEVRRRFDDFRNGVNDGSLDFVDVVEKENLILDAGKMHYIARWITPMGSPRRFDTRFFVARMPASQNPVHDDNELVGSVWMSPQSIIEKVQEGELGMLPPTVRMLERLAMFDNAEDVIAAASAQLEDERVPMLGQSDGARQTEAEPGWVRLRPL